MPAVVIDAQTGEAVSYASRKADVADPLPDGLAAVEVARLPEPGRSRWDAATRAVVDEPPGPARPDRRGELRAALGKPTTTDRELLTALARVVLGE